MHFDLKFYICRLKCPPGHWCTEGTKSQFEHPCSAGTFNKEIGLERQDQCVDCLPGYYCPSGDAYADRLCPAGHYCPDKTGDPNAHPCSPGTYTEEQGAQGKQCAIITLSFLQIEIENNTWACIDMEFLFKCLT